MYFNNNCAFCDVPQLRGTHKIAVCVNKKCLRRGATEPGGNLDDAGCEPPS